MTLSWRTSVLADRHRAIGSKLEDWSGMGTAWTYAKDMHEEHVAIRTKPGEGATITLHLPRFLDAENPQPPVAATPAQTAPQTALTILAVEDEAGVRRFSADALRELGHTVLEADAGPAALRLLDAHPEIDLVFTDVVLPQMNGVRLADEIRRRRPGLPILFTSGFTGHGAANPGTDSPPEPKGVLLLKPFTVQPLATKIAEALQPPTKS